MASRKAYGPMVSKQSSKIDKETSNFIQFYCKKWRAKTLFQVLLQYRAARFQDLFNLSQQIHLFNQSVVNDIQKINYEVDFDCIDSRAQVSGWLGRRKPSVLKMPFRLEDIPFFDTVYLCDPSQRPTGPKDIDEPWDAPLRRKNNVSSQIINASHGYSLTSGFDENQRIRKPSVDKIIFVPYNRNPEEPIRRLSNFQADSDHPMHYGDYQGNNYFNKKPNRSQYSHDDHHRHSYNHTPPVDKSYSRNSGYRGYNSQSNGNSCNSPKKMRNNYNNRNTNANTKPANHDFEYIKPSPKNYNQAPPKPVQSYADSSPIDELQTKFKRSGSADEDDPPFNFKAMLRKTNYNRDSFKDREENSKRYSFKNRDSRNFASVDETNSHYSRNESLRKHRSADEMDAISTELAPGIVVKGYVADL